MRVSCLQSRMHNVEIVSSLKTKDCVVSAELGLYRIQCQDYAVSAESKLCFIHTVKIVSSLQTKDCIVYTVLRLSRQQNQDCGAFEESRLCRIHSVMIISYTQSRLCSIHLDKILSCWHNTLTPPIYSRLLMSSFRFCWRAALSLDPIGSDIPISVQLSEWVGVTIQNRHDLVIDSVVDRPV